MDNASKNAKDMIQRLQMQYNRGRQAAITNELVDIITGMFFFVYSGVLMLMLCRRCKRAVDGSYDADNQIDVVSLARFIPLIYIYS